MHSDLALFDSHLHIIDKRFPLVENDGFVPAEFTCEAYLQQLSGYKLVGGAVVSGSFQAFDQGYLMAALERLGPGFVGVTQLPASVSDEELLSLHKRGVRALRFNLKRGGSATLDKLSSMAARVFELVGWHVELYVNSRDLAELAPTLVQLPAVSIDHLGLRREGFGILLSLVEQGIRVKATGFGRIDFDVAGALQSLYSVNPDALMFGTDLPSTRAPRAYRHADFELAVDTLGSTAAKKVLSENAMAFYRLRSEA